MPSFGRNVTRESCRPSCLRMMKSGPLRDASSLSCCRGKTVGQRQKERSPCSECSWVHSLCPRSSLLGVRPGLFGGRREGRFSPSLRVLCRMAARGDGRRTVRDRGGRRRGSGATPRRAPAEHDACRDVVPRCGGSRAARSSMGCISSIVGAEDASAHARLARGRHAAAHSPRNRG